MNWFWTITTLVTFCLHKRLNRTSRQLLGAKVLRYSFLSIVTVFCFSPECKLIWSDLQPMELQLPHPSLLNNPNHQSYQYKCAIIRIFGNNLYPLQQRDQGSKNLLHILQHEQPDAECPVVWVINRIINTTEKAQIKALLKDKPHLIEVALDHKVLLNYQSLPRDALNHLTDINNARNIALNYALNLNAEWVLLLDGNSFVTSEGYNTMTSYLSNQYSDYGRTAAFIPMSRVLEKTTNKVKLNREAKLSDLKHALSNLQEPYLAFHHKFLSQAKTQNVSLFDSSHGYGKQSKLYTLRQLFQQFPDAVACRQAFEKCALNSWFSTVTDFEDAASECGYALRMLYWPDRSTNSSSGVFTPEKNNSSRAQLRTLSFSYLIKSIKSYLESTKPEEILTNRSPQN